MIEKPNPVSTVKLWVDCLPVVDDCLPQRNRHATPASNSFTNEESRGRKRRRRRSSSSASFDMPKRTAALARLPSLSDTGLSFPLSPTTTGDPSRKRSQSPTKVHDDLALCDPVVTRESASYIPLHAITKSKIKKLIQYLSNESKIITEAEKTYFKDEAQDWTQALHIPNSMLLESHTGKYPPLNRLHLEGIHRACERATREMQNEDAWTTAVVIPVLREGLQSTALEAIQVTSVATCSEYTPRFRTGMTCDRKIDITIGFNQEPYSTLGHWLLGHAHGYSRLHHMEAGFPQNVFMAAGIEIKKFGSSGEGEALIQVMVWAASMLNFLKTILEMKWKGATYQNNIPTLEDFPLLIVATVIGDRWDFYIAYWEHRKQWLQEEYVQVIQGPFPLLSRSASSLFNIARLVRMLQRLGSWAEEEFVHELLRVFAVDGAAVQRRDSPEKILICTQ